MRDTPFCTRLFCCYHQAVLEGEEQFTFYCHAWIHILKPEHNKIHDEIDVHHALSGGNRSVSLTWEVLGHGSRVDVAFVLTGQTTSTANDDSNNDHNDQQLFYSGYCGVPQLRRDDCPGGPNVRAVPHNSECQGT